MLGVYYVSHLTDKLIAGAANQCLGPPDLAARCQGGAPTADGPGYAYAKQHTDYRVEHASGRATAAILHAAYYTRGTAKAGSRRASYYVATDAVIDKVVIAAFSLAY